MICWVFLDQNEKYVLTGNLDIKGLSKRQEKNGQEKNRVWVRLKKGKLGDF